MGGLAQWRLAASASWVLVVLACVLGAGGARAEAKPQCPSGAAARVAVESGLIAKVEAEWGYDFAVAGGVCGHLTADRRADMVVTLTVIGGTGGSPKPWAIFNRRRDGGFRMRHVDFGRRLVCAQTMRIGKRLLTLRYPSEYLGAWTICDRRTGFRWRRGAYARVALEPPFKRCDSTLTYAPKIGRWALIVERLRVSGVSCRRGVRIAGANMAGEDLPSGWRCVTPPDQQTRCLAERRWLTFYAGGDAG